jgi:hypothetical protein
MYTYGNWCALQNGPQGPYWTYMNYGPNSAQSVGKPQMVYNVPLQVGSPTAGIPAGAGYNTTVFGVYVPPPPPPSFWQNCQNSMYNAMLKLYYASGGCAQ